MKDFNKFSPFITAATRAVLDTVAERGFSMEVLALLYRQFVAALPPVAEDYLPCGPGCAWCCHLKVSASVAEVLVILEHLREKGQLPRYQALAASLPEPASRAAADNAWWVANAVPCLFLDPATARCGIYEVRPFSCRAYHSLDAERCRAGYEDRVELGIPCFPDVKRSRELFSVAFAQALAELGLQSGQRELSSTVALFLLSPDLIGRWAAGETALPPGVE